MELIQVIERKKLGFALSAEEIACFVAAATDPASPDYQLSALLMAIRLNGMDARETADLTLLMARSGDMLKADLEGIAVDKHSTGGVGDTTTLVLVPLVAACGAKVLKMSGRGLGHTGGTLDKLESISGLDTTLDEGQILDIVRRVGCVVAGQSAHLAPADKRLYALRDVTSTVDSIPLIASSIMSKKLASGAQGIVLDVKTGDGALMKHFDDCVKLAQAMVDIGTRAGRRVTALITGMEEPLGSHVGNALEVKEAIDVLSGRTEGPLLQVSLLLGVQMLMLAGTAQTPDEAERRLREALQSGAGLMTLRRLIQAQGGDGRVCEDVSRLPQAPVKLPLYAGGGGWLESVETTRIGLIAQGLGAGRLHKDDRIDPAVGLVLMKRIGDEVLEGDLLGTIHARDEDSAARAAQTLKQALHIGPLPAKRARQLYAVITKDFTEVL
ncbi:MAG: thymidine phosphorylase [Christensenellales bacterium]